MTKDEFFKKLEWEGSFEDMAHYMGYKKIIDDEDLDLAWMAFCGSLQDLQDIYDDWEIEHPPEEGD